MEGGSLFLGFDFSTQQIKVLAVDEKLEVVHENHVQFDEDLPEFKTSGGVHVHDDQKTVTAPTLMWVKALDLLLDRMKSSGFPFSRVVALSGAGQQHGSVYWRQGSKSVLAGLSSDKTLFEQLQDCFTVGDSPVWMDASTTSQCRQLEDKVGGPQALASITGSKAFERFTGSQIMKFYQTNKKAYDETERISLVSSFGASLFVGEYAPIDGSDGTGMNLLDIWTRKWSKPCLEACGDSNLPSKLGEEVVHSSQKVGKISGYFVSRYGFNPACDVVAFVGDNPASLAGLAPKQGDVIVSLGTSDTVFLWLTNPTPGVNGHVFDNPVAEKDFMSLTCFKNGSLTRERIRDENTKGSWEDFSEVLKSTPAGNGGNIGIYFDSTEIQPFVQGCFRFDANGAEVPSFSPEVEVRAVIEGQFMARRMHAEAVGFKLGPNTHVIATGGGSKNQQILQVLSDVFNSPVYVKDVPNSACLGCALRAKHSWMGGSAAPDTPFATVASSLDPPTLIASPTHGQDDGVYDKLYQRYKEIEGKVAQKYTSA